MNFYDYIKSLTESELQDYASRCSTTPDYIKVHLVYGTKIPRPPLLRALALESDGKLSIDDVLNHFYGYQNDKKSTKQQASSLLTR